jgi:hypothetical protein
MPLEHADRALLLRNGAGARKPGHAGSDDGDIDLFQLSKEF